MLLLSFFFFSLRKILYLELFSKNKKKVIQVHFFTTTQKYAQKISKEKLFRTKKRIDR